MTGDNLLVLQIFGIVDGMAGHIMAPFEPLVNFSGDDSDLCWTLAAIMHQALHNSDPFISSRVVIFRALLLLEANVHLLIRVSRRLHQAAVVHKFLHEHVNFMIDLCGFQCGILSCGPPLDFSEFEVRMELERL